MITSKISRLALVSGFAILGTVALTPKSQAQTANVDFQGDNPATCQINSVTNGTLAVSSTAPGRAMVADATDGLPGNLNVTCNAGVKFTITSVADNGTTVPYNAIDGVFTSIKDGTTDVAVGNLSPSGSNPAGYNNAPGTAGALQSGPITNKDYKVMASVFNLGSTGLLPLGTYNVRVGVSLAPQ